jgi:hypothetical protein
MYFRSQLLGTLYVRRDEGQDAPRLDREPQWFEVFEHSPGSWVVHLGRFEVFYDRPERRPSRSLS